MVLETGQTLMIVVRDLPEDDDGLKALLNLYNLRLLGLDPKLPGLSTNVRRNFSQLGAEATQTMVGTTAAYRKRLAPPGSFLYSGRKRGGAAVLAAVNDLSLFQDDDHALQRAAHSLAGVLARAIRAVERLAWPAGPVDARAERIGPALEHEAVRDLLRSVFDGDPERHCATAVSLSYAFAVLPHRDEGGTDELQVLESMLFGDFAHIALEHALRAARAAERAEGDHAIDESACSPTTAKQLAKQQAMEVRVAQATLAVAKAKAATEERWVFVGAGCAVPLNGPGPAYVLIDGAAEWHGTPPTGRSPSRGRCGSAIVTKQATVAALATSAAEDEVAAGEDAAGGKAGATQTRQARQTRQSMAASVMAAGGAGQCGGPSARDERAAKRQRGQF